MWAADAATDADVVIVSIPQKNVPDLAAGIVAKAKPRAPVIETNNYYPRQRDGRIAAIEDGTPESGLVLIDQAAEDRPTPDPAADRLRDRRVRARWAELQRSMWPHRVVMHRYRQHAAQVSLAEDQHPVVTSVRTVSTKRSA